MEFERQMACTGPMGMDSAMAQEDQRKKTKTKKPFFYGYDGKKIELEDYNGAGSSSSLPRSSEAALHGVCTDWPEGTGKRNRHWRKKPQLHLKASRKRKKDQENEKLQQERKTKKPCEYLAA